MTRGSGTLGVVCAACVAAGAVVALAQQAPADGPRYENGTHLVRPDDYREWTFLSSGLAMTYEEETTFQRRLRRGRNYVPECLREPVVVSWVHGDGRLA